MSAITIQPQALPVFGPAEGAAFCLVTRAELVEQFEIDAGSSYYSTHAVVCEPGDDFERILLNEVPERAHVLVITPGPLFESPKPGSIGPGRKLAVMACTSTPTSFEAICHFLEVLRRTDDSAMEEFADLLFTLGEASEYLNIIDETTGSVARFDHLFDHLSDDLEWFEQLGRLDWGQQQMVPSGEISVLPLFHGNYDSLKRPEVNGKISLWGYPTSSLRQTLLPC